MPKPSKQIVIDAIIKGIELGNERGNLLATVGKKWRLSQRTFDRYWKTAQEQHIVTQEAIKSKLAIIDMNAAIDGRKMGLKSKLDRALKLQKEIDIMEKQLRGDLKFNYVVGNKIMISHTGNTFTVPIQVQNEIRQTIKSFQSEISKMEGDYSATKVEHTGGLSLDTFLIHGKKFAGENTE